MNLALYCPDCGYYEAERDTPGRHGDFFTSVSVGKLFGALLAFQFSGWLEPLAAETGELQIVEGGAHCGTLAHDILDWLQACRPKLCERLRYIILEPSARRREWQRRTLRGFAARVRWSAAPDDLAHAGVSGIIFSNELLDAMPVHRLGWDRAAGQWFEWGVALHAGQFGWTRMRKTEVGSQKAEGGSPAEAAEVVPRDSWPELPAGLQEVLPNGFTTEICPAAERWWQGAARALRRGKLLTLDYGLTAEEFLSPDRAGGTLRAYADHRVNPDVLAQPGEQDITAHVNFTTLQRAGEAAGLHTEQFISQESFLMRIAERFLLESPPAPELTPAFNRQLQTLTHPEHLGRRFRVLLQTRS